MDSFSGMVAPYWILLLYLMQHYVKGSGRILSQKDEKVTSQTENYLPYAAVFGILKWSVTYEAGEK